MEIKIKDNGQGISEEGLKNLFVNFSKLDEHTKSNASGTGLGLSICQQIIKQMGGNITCKSELGVGSEFNITLNTQCKMSWQDTVNLDNSKVIMHKGHDEKKL
jgi:signal transduction histidine kinase